MKTISTHYLPCTEHRPSRIVATDGDNRVIIGGADDATDPHLDAIRALCAKLNWHGELVVGNTKAGGRVAVFAEDERITV